MLRLYPLNTRLHWLRLVTHVGAWIPLAWLLWAVSTGNLTVNPIQAATQYSGKDALVFLVLSLAVTPIHTLTGYRPVLKVRRALGLYAFFYALVHVFIFTVIDYGLDWGLLQGAIFEKTYILVGLATLIILTSLAVTSFKWWMKRMGKRWTRLHRLIYLAGLLVILHFAWSLKGNLFSLQGDITQPLAFGLAVVLLLAARIPRLRRWISNQRSRLLHRRPTAGLRQQRAV
ncbi:MAG: sulfoxide reductase heme-binding subunit YedZ [Anaerolineales bacterium]